MRDGYKARGVTPYITGFENNRKDSGGSKFNIIMSNGDRSVQRDDDYPTSYTHLLP
jgi:hypothetical protein